MTRAVLGSLFFLLACPADENDGYEAFGSQDDAVHVRVGVSEVQPDESTELHSNTGEHVVGEGWVSPGGGPSGTEHQVSVRLTEDASYVVDRVSLNLYSPGRSERELDMVRDQLDRSLFLLDLVSVGEEDGLSRTDVFTFKLWDLADDEDPALSSDTSTED
ncbi:MAG: hypothetical protein VX519_00735 [Myxococcota bacterium]|nr:hypothetical protein [Myxococcota bacterium]